MAYAKLLTDYLPATLNCVYFTNSGTEATEGAMKLAKRITGRTKIQAFHNAYHGSTQGSLSIMGSEYWRNAYRPLLPEVYHLEYGSDAALEAIDANTACVVVEMVQAEAGIVRPANEWLQALRDKCTANGVMLIADEIQSGFGRTGTLWAFEQTGIVPDILLLGKALGGGMPLGEFIAAREFMQLLTHDPVLGHITTFGGHPVSCAAGKAAFEVLLDRNFTKTVKEKESFLKMHLQHPAIKTIRSAGLWMAVEFDSFETNYKVIHQCIQHGLITDWFLFRSQAMRIAPPLCIQKNELKKIAGIVLQSIIDTGVE